MDMSEIWKVVRVKTKDNWSRLEQNRGQIVANQYKLLELLLNPPPLPTSLGIRIKINFKSFVFNPQSIPSDFNIIFYLKIRCYISFIH